MVVNRRQGRVIAFAMLVAAVNGCTHGEADAMALTHGGNAARGKELIRSYGCGSCHTIPRVPGAESTVGPSLQGEATHAYIAGVTPNLPENMIRWIMDPPSIDDKTAMPNLHVSAVDARDIAAYIYTLQ
ncbi:MAG: c-type cytochrome [Gemmatimonadaceae bacterium]